MISLDKPTQNNLFSKMRRSLRDSLRYRPLNEEELRAEKKRKEEEAKERARKMTPIEIMFATQAALKETMNRNESSFV